MKPSQEASTAPAVSNGKAGKARHPETIRRDWRWWVMVSMVAVQVIGSLMIKWFVAVSIRKLLASVDESSLLAQTPSKFWQVIFLDSISFHGVVGMMFFVAAATAWSQAIERSMSLSIAQEMARNRRATVLTRAVDNPMVTANDPHEASFLLEQISLMCFYEGSIEKGRIVNTWIVFAAILLSILFFWQASLVSLVLLIATELFGAAVDARAVVPLQKELARLSRKIHQAVLDCIRAADVVAVHNMETPEAERLCTFEAPATRVSASLSRANLFFKHGPANTAFYSLLPLSLVVGNAVLTEGDLNELFGLLAMFFMFDECHKAMMVLGRTDGDKKSYASAVEHYRAFLDDERTSSFEEDNVRVSVDPSSGGGEPSPGAKGDLVFRNVAVRYDVNSPPVISNVSFRVEENTTLAMVAESGAGKSSLLNAAAGLVPHTGDIMLGNLRLSPTSHVAIRKSLGMVRQDSHLFARSIRENVWFGHHDSVPDDKAIWAALQAVGLADWVGALQDGLDTVLATEHSVSGGQAQRLQIARLLCRHWVKFVLLDECLSALDPFMRDLVSSSLRDFLRDKTCIMITHHHSLVSKLCDTVLDLGTMQVQPASEWALAMDKEGAKVDV